MASLFTPRFLCVDMFYGLRYLFFFFFFSNKTFICGKIDLFILINTCANPQSKVAKLRIEIAFSGIVNRIGSNCEL